MNGNGLTAQRKSVEDYLNGGRWSLVDEFTEVESGKRADRPELEKALAACKKQKQSSSLPSSTGCPATWPLSRR